MIIPKTKILNLERVIFRVFKNQLLNLHYRLGVSTVLPPVSCQLEITTVCNYNCVMCNRHFVEKERKNKMMSMEEFETILNNFPKTMKHIFFVGQLGDAFCHPRFYDFLDMATRRNYQISIATNGSRLTKERIDELTKFNLWRLHVSLDATDKETYSNIRGGDIEKIVGSLKYLKMKKPQTLLFLAMVLMKDTVGQINSFFETANNINPDLIILQMMIPYSIDIWRGQSLYNDPDKLDKVVEFINEQFKNSTLNLMRGGGSKNWNLNPVNGFCDSAFFLPQIMVNGDVVPCCVVSNANEEFTCGIRSQINPCNYIIGNVLDESLLTLWNNKKIKQIRKGIISSYKRGDRRIGKSKSLNIKDFENIKRNTSTGKGFDYCKVCALRWQVGG